ncbi:MAG: copper homeostasis protein CutC [Aureispira sp.]|nr:copper homeostasis protein CutC [Aureispira sp.]
MKIELCIDSVEAALTAQEYGANRVELCANLLEGGTTPSIGTIALTRKAIDIDLFVIVRPRGGDFLYSDKEFEVMQYNILEAKKLGVDGVVVGLLDRDGEIDIVRTQKLVELARPMQVTFHRAFDRCLNPFDALEQLIELGVDRILTSGQELTAWQGRELIKNLIKQADNRICIMPGSGVNADNIPDLAKYTQAQEFHFTAAQYREGDMLHQNPKFPREEYQKKVFDQEKLTQSIQALRTT